MKRNLPAVMTNGGNHQSSGGNLNTLSKRRNNYHPATMIDEETDGADDSVSSPMLPFRPDSSASSRFVHQHPPPSSDRSGSSNSWNISPGGLANHQHGWSSLGPFGGGLAGNNGVLMHNAAADLLADCRLPESSL